MIKLPDELGVKLVGQHTAYDEHEITKDDPRVIITTNQVIYAEADLAMNIPVGNGAGMDFEVPALIAFLQGQANKGITHVTFEKVTNNRGSGQITAKQQLIMHQNEHNEYLDERQLKNEQKIQVLDIPDSEKQVLLKTIKDNIETDKLFVARFYDKSKDFFYKKLPMDKD